MEFGLKCIIDVTQSWAYVKRLGWGVAGVGGGLWGGRWGGRRRLWGGHLSTWGGLTIQWGGHGVGGGQWGGGWPLVSFLFEKRQLHFLF